MKMPSGIKTVYRYFMSYAGVALLSCALVGIALFIMATGEMRAAHTETQRERLQIGADMLEENVGLMRETALLIQFQSYFRPSYLAQNGYHAYLMLDYLSRYQNAVPLCDEYFLMYHGSDLVYKVGDVKGSNRFNVYSESTLRIADGDALYRRLQAADTYTVFPLENTDITLLAFPVHLSGEAGGAVLCYVLRGEKLFRQITAAIGEVDGTLAFSFDGTPVAADGAAAPSLWAASPGGGVTLALTPDENSRYDRLDNYSRFSYIFITGVTLFMLGVAIYAAWRSYRPIRELVTRFVPAEARGDDLQRLSAVMGELFEQNRLSSRQLLDEMDKLADQRQIIRRQMVQLILCGQYESQPQRLLQDLDPHARERLYGVLTVRPEPSNPSDPLDPGLCEALLPLVEGLSDETMSFHGIVLRNARSAAFLCLMTDSGDLDDVRDLVEEVCAERGLQVRCGVGMVSDSLSRIPVSLLDALSDAQEPGAHPAAEGCRDGELLQKRLLTEVEAANAEQALRLLSRLVEQIMENSSYLARICAFSDIINALMHVAHRRELRILDERIHMLAVLQDPEGFHALARELIQRICGELTRQSVQHNAQLVRRLLDYIQENVSDYQMDLGRLSEVFGIPVKRVSLLVKESTGLPYKDYLKEVRVERACRLLTRENLSVSETCARVGLTEVSYFIRMFKNVTGETPANYRRRQGADPAASDRADVS